jgi:hypothetical protein
MRVMMKGNAVIQIIEYKGNVFIELVQLTDVDSWSTKCLSYL